MRLDAEDLDGEGTSECLAPWTSCQGGPWSSSCSVSGAGRAWASKTSLATGASTHAPLVQQHTVALFEDEQRFIDHAHSPIFLAEEHEVLAPITGGGAMDAETAWDEP